MVPQNRIYAHIVGLVLQFQDFFGGQFVFGKYLFRLQFRILVGGKPVHHFAVLGAAEAVLVLQTQIGTDKGAAGGSVA